MFNKGMQLIIWIVLRVAQEEHLLLRSIDVIPAATSAIFAVLNINVSIAESLKVGGGVIKINIWVNCFRRLLD